jgi:hypothetical protein
MEPTTGYAILGDERIAYQIIGEGPVDLVVTAGWWSPFDIEWDEPSIGASRTVKDLVVGSDLTFEDRGVHTLKGIDDPWRLSAVVA